MPFLCLLISALFTKVTLHLFPIHPHVKLFDQDLEESNRVPDANPLPHNLHILYTGQ